MSERTYSRGPEETMGIAPARRQPDCRYACPQEPYLLQAMHRQVCRMVQARCAEMYSRLYHDMRSTVSDMMRTIEQRGYCPSLVAPDYPVSPGLPGYPGMVPSPGSGPWSRPASPVLQSWFPMPTAPGAPERPGACSLPDSPSPGEQPAEQMAEREPLPTPASAPAPGSRPLPRPSRRPTLIIPTNSDEKPAPTSSIKVTFGPDSVQTIAPAEEQEAILLAAVTNDDIDAPAEESVSGAEKTTEPMASSEAKAEESAKVSLLEIADEGSDDEKKGGQEDKRGLPSR
ncbi:conserved hypothetical protein [Heliomicrobium modesticaldum Ice1]|uniref:Uncharacterized protein n=1 Tax=Heliobacterium modesticaldum (strain ATCC 51547 / Ice1) TaxID=498761 RepID=B0TFR1_HELMI|nr:conserved hypothetical protein [Heliomicrobium modesticaldum Ice1]